MAPCCHRVLDLIFDLFWIDVSSILGPKIVRKLGAGKLSASYQAYQAKHEQLKQQQVENAAAGPVSDDFESEATHGIHSDAAPGNSPEQEQDKSLDLGELVER